MALRMLTVLAWKQQGSANYHTITLVACYACKMSPLADAMSSANSGKIAPTTGLIEH